MPNKKTNVIPREIAIEELTSFLKKHMPKAFKRGVMTVDKIEEDYIDVIEAIEDGLILFDEHNKPVFKLSKPLVAETDDSLSVREITFKGRVVPSKVAELMSGINPAKDQGKYQLRFISFITGLSRNEIDKLDPYDHNVINQIGSVF